MTLSADDRQELQDLVSRYASAVDRRDFETVGSLFTADGVLATPRSERRGRDEIVTAMEALRRYDRTFHLIGQVRLWEEGSEARGEAYCAAHHFTGGSGPDSDHVMFIRYDDTFVRSDDLVRPDGPVGPDGLVRPDGVVGPDGFVEPAGWSFARRVLDVVATAG